MATKKMSEITKVTTAGDNDYIVMNTVDGKNVQIKKTDLANALADVMRTATTEINGLMSSTDKLNTTSWYSNSPMGGSMKSLWIETNLGKQQYDSYHVYLNLGQCYNLLWNEVFYVNISCANYSLNKHAINRIGTDKKVKNIVACFNENDILYFVVNFINPINNHGGASEITVKRRHEGVIITPTFSTEEYIPQAGDYVITI